MAQKTLQTRLKLKKDTAANWESKNPILRDGEQIFVITAAGETRVKVGDGTKTYTQLPFTDESLRTLVGTKADKTTTITAGNGLTGGGDLSANRTISHADTSSVSNVTANGRKYITGLTFDDYGHVTGTTTGTETVTDTGATKVSVSGSGNAVTTASYDASTRTITLTKGATYNNYSLPVATSSALGGVKSGTDITVDSSGNVSVSNDSHSHSNSTITSVDASKVSSGTLAAARLPAATTSAQGAMSAADKVKLDGIETGANKYTLPVATLSALGGVKSGTDITVDSSGNVSVVNDSHTHSDSTITSLDASKLTGTIPSSILPSYVDDVIECNNLDSFPLTGETGKIYVDLSTNLTYRWSGTQYVEISPSLALGTTSSTAFRGDYGNTAYTHATAKGSAFSSGLYKITTNAQGHVTAATAVTKSDITGLGIPDAPFKPTGKSYLTFSSPNSFTLAVSDTTKHWDGTLEYFASDKNWTVWDGTTTLSSVDNDGDNVLYLRGTGNTKITGYFNPESDSYTWVLTGSNINCIGNIENLLDYATVESGEHPTMATYCYLGMFMYCTSLTQAPALPATTLAENCYQYMFNGCTSLTQAPALPATTLAAYCYYGMFNGCISLTQAPLLPATTLAEYCYCGMFVSCALIKAPSLPATTLENACYAYMFAGCSLLTQVPVLPATVLTESCYYYMFIGCESIKLSTIQTGEYTQEYRIPSSGTGTTTTDALTDMFLATGGTFTETPEINTTYYLSTDNMVVHDTEVATLNGYVGSMIDVATPKILSITLLASSWDSTALTQTVTANGVLSDETSQIITPTPALASQSAYYDAGILCTGQAENSLTFTCETVPTVDLTVYVVIQEVRA